ncbi:MAG: acyl-CoA dehydrogenase family protein [Anaerolineae bacterium]
MKYAKAHHLRRADLAASGHRHDRRHGDECETSRLLAWKAAWLVDEGQSNTKLAAYAKAFAADTADEDTVDGADIFGYGFMKEYPVEKLMRDVKVFQIYEGTSQVQRTIIMRELFK